MTRNLKKHQENEFHQWCANFEKEENQKKLREEEYNIKACTLLTTNVVYCIKTFGSSFDWVRLNDKDNLTAELEDVVATKNDGRQEFFKYRDMCFTHFNQNFKLFFKEKINHAAITLDKVTIGSVSYTVLCTLFFWNGKIQYFLNKLHKMNVDEYDTKGTAEMVGKVIMETLGLSREEIKSCIHHFSYDGVYATNEERQTGGGLKLRDQFAKWLGLEKGAITGNHNLAHNLQLAFGETLGSHKFYKKNIENIYRAMSEQKTGKEKKKNAFEQFARQWSWAVLQKKLRQTTQFVCSDL